MESYLIAAAYTTLVFLVRLLVLCLTLPLFLMAAFVGLVDGWCAGTSAASARDANRGSSITAPGPA